MRPRTKKFGKRFLSLFLSLAICATLLPTVALAEDAELIKFKNMHMTVLRNGTAVANYDYFLKRNDFEHDIAFALNDTWVKLNYVISYSQYVSLELYKMADGQDWQTGNPLELKSYIDPASPPNYGADVKEEFLGDFIGYLNGVRVTDMPPISEPLTSPMISMPDTISAQVQMAICVKFGMMNWDELQLPRMPAAHNMLPTTS